jgi:uncharacterized lipoprotein YmbA
MKTWLVLLCALLLAGCTRSDPKKEYYQLPTLTSTAGQRVSVANIHAQRPIWVEKVTVADFLAGDGLVYQTNDVQFVIAHNNLWAGPLDQQLQQTLISYLGYQLPGRVISSQQVTAEQDTLNVHISAFQGRFDGSVIVSGDWMFSHDGQVVKHDFSVQLPQHQDGYPALVRGLAEAWQQAVLGMASQIR